MPTTPGSIIKIKRSSTSVAPLTLAVGEMAYSWGAGAYNDGGERLYIGYGTADINGNGTIGVIGGRYFTKMLEHERGKLKENSALIVDANRKIDQLKTTNITIGGNGNNSDLVAPNDIAADGGLRLRPSNNTVYIGSMYSLPTTAPVTTGYVLTGNSDGTSSWSAPSTSLYVSGDVGDELQVDLLSETFEIGGDDGQGIYTIGYAGSVNGFTGSRGNNLNISARNAGYFGSKGVASFNSDDFNLTSGYASLSGSVPRFFTTNDNSYLGSNGAKTTNGEIKIKGSSTDGIETTVIDGNTIQIKGIQASSSQKGVAKFSNTYFSFSEDGSVSPNIATKNIAGVAAFPDTQFHIDSVSGAITILQATDSTEGQQGVADFNSTHFTVNEGTVSAKSIWLGTTELILGEGEVGHSANNSVEGLTDISVGNIKISDYTIESFHATDPNKDIILKPKGTGNVKINNSWYLPGATANASAIKGYVLTYNEDNTSSWQRAVSELTIRDQSNTSPITFSLLDKGIEFAGDSNKGITASISGYTGSYPGVRISANYSGYSGSTAGTSNVGVASFYSDTFEINQYGGVNVKSGGISNSQLANSVITIGSTNFYLGSSSTVVNGLTNLNFDTGLSIYGYQGSFSTITSPSSIHLNSTGTGQYQGYVKIGTDAWNLPNSKGSVNQVLTADGNGSASWQSVARVQYIDTDGSTSPGGYIGSFNLGTDTLTISGDGAIYTDMTGHTVFIGVDTADYNNLGVAKFSNTDFVVDGGNVELVGEVLTSVGTNNGTTAIPYGHNLKVFGYTGSATDPRAGAIFTVGYGGSSGANPDGAKVDIVARIATNNLTGVASFSSDNFTITDGNVTSKKFTIGNVDINLGQSAVTTLTGLSSVTIGKINIQDNIISNSNPNLANDDIVLSPKGDGVVNVDGSRITGLATPTGDTDAVTKAYADAMASGLDVKLSVRLGTNAPLNAGYTGSSGHWGYLTNAGTQAELVVDGFTVINGDRILVKDQGIVTVDGTKYAQSFTTTISATAVSGNQITLVEVVSAPKGTKWKTPVGFSGVTNLSANTTYYIAENVVASKQISLSATYVDAISTSPTIITLSGTPSGTLTGAMIGDDNIAKQNGIYVVTDAGSNSTNWVLTRSNDANETSEVNAGMFTFIEEGDVWADSGFILITNNPMTVGDTPLIFTQFSSAGRILAGAGLEKSGDNINIVASPTSGITVNVDSIEISSTIAGNALNFTDGILGVNFDNTTIGYTGSVTKNLRIHENYPGQASITTLGTIGTGVWNATTIGVTKGGTGLSSIAKGDILYGSDNNVISKRTVGGRYKFLMVGTDDLPAWSDIDGGEY